MAKTHSQAKLTDSSLTLTSASSKHKRLVPLKYSCEEVWERMGNGLCIFCEEKDSPEHQLKHKRLCIVAKECDDQPLDESMPQFQVPVSASKILKSIEPGKVDLGLEKLEHVVMNENLEQECDQKNVNEKLVVDGDVEKDQKVMSDTKIYSAHQLFDQKPVRVTHKEKHMKQLKAWKFKFKPNPKRSRLMDDKFSFVDATVLLNKDPKETIWDCVKKELKETMAACEKNRVDRFKLAEEKESKLQVLDLHQTFMCRQIGRVWEPVGLPNKMDLWDWLETELKACGESQQVERFLYSLMQVVKRNLEFKTFESNKTFSDFDIASSIGLEICGFETKKHVLMLMKLANRVWECGGLLATSQKMQKMDLFSFDTHTEMEENVELRQLLVAMERFSQEVIEQKIEGGLSCGDVKFHLKHKWRFRLLESFSVVKFGRYTACDAWLLPFPGDEKFQIKHKWRFKLLLLILELELYLDSLVLITSYAHQFDIISLIILMRVELSVFFPTKPDGFFFSTNLEVKVSLKGEDVIQVKRRKKNGTCGT